MEPPEGSATSVRRLVYWPSPAFDGGRVHPTRGRLARPAAPEG